MGLLQVYVSIRFFTILREITNKKEQKLVFRNGKSVTLNTVLKELSKEYGKSFDEYVYDANTGEVKGYLQFLVNGRSVFSTRELDVELLDGDILAIVPPVGGG
jgi:MoaD family protein